MTGMNVESMYQQIILDHYRRPHHAQLRDPFDVAVHHVNPSCGDEIELRVRLTGEPGVETIDDVSYEAVGCSISQASTSVMTDLVIGRTVTDANAVYEEFRTMMHGQGRVEPDEEVLDDGIAFAGVAKFPARIKCALLGWSAWRDAAAAALAARESADAGFGTRRSTDADTYPGLDRRRHRRTPMSTPDLDTAIDTDDGRPAPDPATVSSLAEQPPADSVSSDDPFVDDLMEALKDVVDPELGINVVDLGLIYGVTVDEDKRATIDMTLTSAACPLTDMIEDQTSAALEGLVEGHTINWVWMPPWGPEKITDDGREQLRALGFRV